MSLLCANDSTNLSIDGVEASRVVVGRRSSVGAISTVQSVGCLGKTEWSIERCASGGESSVGTNGVGYRTTRDRGLLALDLRRRRDVGALSSAADAEDGGLPAIAALGKVLVLASTCPMCSDRGDGQLRPTGFPIRKSPDRCLVADSSGLIAGSNVLLRLRNRTGSSLHLVRR